MKFPLKSIIALMVVMTIASSTFGFNRSLIPTSAHQYDVNFEKAYEDYPTIPKGLLQAVSFSYTRLQNYVYDESSAESCLGLPRTYGIMGLTENGRGFFKNNLKYVSVLSGYTKEELKNDPAKAIDGYAKAYVTLLAQQNDNSGKWVNHANVLRTLSELPQNTIQQDFALNSQLYVMFWFLNEPNMQAEFNFPNHAINLSNVFGYDNYKVLSSSHVDISNDSIQNSEGKSYSKMPGPCSDYPGSIWVAADASNFSSRSGTAISAITIHDIEGSYAGAISWFQNPSSNVSAHYCLRSIDGQVTQMVCDADKAWHVGTENPYAVGLEHEGKADFEGWYTEAMYQASASVCLDAMADYSIDPLRSHEGPPEYGITTLGGCIKLKGHQHFANSTHRDPGLNWDWEYFYRLLNDGTTLSPTIYTSASGTIHDSGGSGSNYGDDERLYDLIEPAGATSVTLTFSQFDLELDWDYLYIYDGNSNHDNLIGVYTGTNSPGTVTGGNGALLLEFRSDCATTNPGWTASYTSTTTPLACAAPSNLSESAITPVSANLSWSGSASAYLLRHRDHTYNPWTYEVVSGTSKTLTGLSSNSEYYWGVASLCGVDTSSFDGSFFTTAAIGSSVSITECDGTFRDSGGPLGVYMNSEDYTYTITASGPITVTFNSFNIEASWDFLYIHDGPTTASAQIGGSPFTGTGAPATFTSSGNELTFRFTSDGATVSDGWEADWYCTPAGPPSPSASFSASTNTICTSDSIQLINSSTDASAYAWTITGGSPATSTDSDPWVVFPSSGAYPVELIASGTGGNDTVTQIINVTINPSPTAGGIPSNSTVYLPSGTVTFSNISTDADSYYWDFGNGSTSTDTNPWTSYSTAGSYTVMLIASNSNCENDTSYINIDVLNPTSLEENDLNVGIFPNPADEEVQIIISSLTPQEGTLILFDIAGKMIREEAININSGQNTYSLKRNSLSSGAYVLKINTPITTSTTSLIFR